MNRLMVLQARRLVATRGRGPPQRTCAYEELPVAADTPHIVATRTRCMGAGIAAGGDEPDRARC